MLAATSVALLAGCASPGPEDLPKIDTAAHRNVSRIIRECEIHLAIKGPVKLGADFLPVPYAGTAVDVTAAALDMICANPEKFAFDEAIVKWIIENAGKH